jgi:hypothetical protein
MLSRLAADASGTSFAYACYHTARGDVDEALKWAARAADRNYMLTLIDLVRPFQKVLSKSFAWPALLHQLGLLPTAIG